MWSLRWVVLCRRNNIHSFGLVCNRHTIQGRGAAENRRFLGRFHATHTHVAQSACNHVQHSTRHNNPKQHTRQDPLKKQQCDVQTYILSCRVVPKKQPLGSTINCIFMSVCQKLVPHQCRKTLPDTIQKQWQNQRIGKTHVCVVLQCIFHNTNKRNETNYKGCVFLVVSSLSLSLSLSCLFVCLHALLFVLKKTQVWFVSSHYFTKHKKPRFLV